MNLNEKKGQRSKLARSIACFECTLNFVARQLSRLQKRKADSESAFSIYWKIINNNPFYFEHFTFSGRFSTWPIRCMTHIIWLISFGVFVNGAKGEYWRGNALMRCKNSVVENREGLYGKSLRGQTINVRIKKCGQQPCPNPHYLKIGNYYYYFLYSFSFGFLNPKVTLNVCLKANQKMNTKTMKDKPDLRC